MKKCTKRIGAKCSKFISETFVRDILNCTLCLTKYKDVCEFLSAELIALLQSIIIFNEVRHSSKAQKRVTRLSSRALVACP